MISDIYELSPLQAGMLFHRVFAPSSTAYFDQFTCRLRGAVDPERLQRAWQQLVDRHPVLRTSFHWEGLDKPVQVVHAQVALPWESFDWRGDRRTEQDSRWAEHVARDRARGFDPSAAPLMRVTLARVADDEWLCCWSHHHLLLDGWCLQLVLSELFERYAALVRGVAFHAAPVRPYSEYIKWLQHRDRAAADDFWRRELHGFHPTALPTAAPSLASDRHRQADRVIEQRLDREFSDRVRDVAARRRLTLSTLVQGAWALVLSRYTARDDVAFGATVSGRPPELPGVETMLGVFINTVPARIGVPEDVAVATWLEEIQTKHVSREAFAAVPLTEIQKLAGVDPATPLFDTSVIVMNYRLDDELVRGAEGIAISDVHVFDQTDSPLTLQVTPGAGISIEMLYDSGRFEADAIARMLGHFIRVLEQFVADPDARVGSVDILTAAERTQLFDQFNATAAPLDATQTAMSLWRARVAEAPDAIALECDGITLTFRQVDEWANRVARGLQRLAPPGSALGADALIAIAFKRSEKLVVAILAVWKWRAAYVPIDPDYPSERIRQIVDAASPLLVIRESGTLDAALEASYGDRVRFAALSEIEAAGSEGPATAVDEHGSGSDLAYVIFTSGSTGQPKGAMVEQIGMLNHLLAKHEDFQLDARSIIVQNASHCFDISVWQCFAAMMAGGRTIVYTDALVLNPAKFLDRVRHDRVTVLEVVPSYLGALLDVYDNDPRPLDDLQYLLVTGEVVKPALVERWFRTCPAIPIVNAYGPTEASDDITHAIMREPPAFPTVPVGSPLRNFHIYIVDEQMRLCPIGIAGEVCVSGPGVGRGYLRDAVKTAAAFLEDPFRAERGVRMYRTGDVGWFTSDGTILLAGRKDYQVKVRGYRIELGDIEAALASLPMVRDAAVVARRDGPQDSMALAAYVSLRESDAAPAEILQLLGSRVPEYMVPATCTILAALPLTPNGKIDRKALPAPERVSRSTATHVAPRSRNEIALAEIWADVLGVEKPGIHDNFFAAGGDSILSMQIVSRAARAGLSLTPRDIFQHQTIAELAAAATAVNETASRPPRRSGAAPLAPAQREFFENVTLDRHHYNQSVLLEVPPGFDASRAARALAAIVEHHEALRLRFAIVDGEWRQDVAAVESAAIFETHAISAVTDADRLAVVERIGDRVQRGFDLEHGPLIGAAYLDFGPDANGRLLIAAHHLAVDGVSWRILLDDLADAYDTLASRATVSLPPVPVSFLDWSASIADTAKATQSSTMDARNTVDSSAEITVDLDEDTTRAFLTASPGANGGPTGVLSIAVARAVGQWTGQRRIVIDLERHGRDRGGVDLTRTVGWFTSTEPTVIDLPDDASLASARIESPTLLLNYHGRIEPPRGEWRLASESHGAARSGRQLREYAIEINALVIDNRLRVAITFSRACHDDRTMQSLADAITRSLRDGIASPGDASFADAEDTYALSPTQHGLLFHSMVEQTRDAYFNQLTCALDGALDVGAFQDAWRQTVARHAALRTSFHWRGLERPVQIVHRQAEIPWHIDDWSGIDEAAQQRRWTALADQDRARPFDIAVAPLMRCALIRMGDRRHLFRWSQHHLLLDGWSSSIVLNDVLSAYAAIVGGRHPDQPPAPRFRDHVDWLARQDAAAAERFWRAHLAGFEQPPALVLGVPEMEGRAVPGRMAEAELTLPPPFASQLKQAAAAHRITLNTLFQGAWSLLLGRYGDSHDVVFGGVVSGRPASLDRSNDMVGLFINTLPVRARIADATPVFDWLRRLQADNIDRETYAHASLADVQRWSEVPGGAALFETIFIFENYPIAAALTGVDTALRISDVQAREPNNYPITFVVTPGDAISLKIMFDAGRFDRATIDRALGHISTLLAGMIAAPEAAVGALPMLTREEVAQLDAWNDTAKPLADGETVLTRFEQHARATPDRIAVMCDGESVSYGELNRRANDLARRWLASPLPSESRIVVLLRRSPRLIETILAIWKCGGAYVPVDPDYPVERILAVVENARPISIVADGRELDATLAAALRERARLILVDERDTLPSGEIEAPAASASLAYVIYTSGSTGIPKGAMVEHRGLLNHVSSMIDDLDIGPASVVAQTASLSFDISMWQMFAALVAGGRTVIYTGEVRRPVQLAARFEIDGVSLAQFVPSYLTAFIDALELADVWSSDDQTSGWSSDDQIGGWSPDDQTGKPALVARGPRAGGPRGKRPRFKALKRMASIGEALPSATISRWFHLYPDIPLTNTYGPTEASDSVAHFEIDTPLGDALVPIGRPIQNVSLYVVDADMRRCAIGVKGEICIAGAAVGRGYLFDQPRTDAVFGRDPFNPSNARLYRTGDVGCYRPDGALLFFGRRDHQVKIRGHRLELGEIESCLASIDGVRDAAVVVRKHTSGDALIAYVTAAGNRSLDEPAIVAALASRLPRHAVPEVVRVLADMPVTTSGKIDRRSLAQRAIAEATNDHTGAPPNTPTEIAVARIWSDVLQQPEIAADRSFFDLGGHSLTAIRIASRIGRDLGVDVGVDDLFAHATVRALAARIDSMTASELTGPVAQPVSEDYETSAMQQRIWLASRTPEGSAAYIMAAEFQLDGDVDVEALARAVTTVIERHDSLRTVFVTRGGVLRQRIGSLRAADMFHVTDSGETRGDAPLDLASGPLFDVTLTKNAGRRANLRVRMHHIISDAASIAIVLRETLALYGAFRRGLESPLTPLPLQYRDLVAWQNARVTASRERSRHYWIETLSDPPPRIGFPHDREDVALPPASVTAHAEIDAALTGALRAVARRYDTTMFSVMTAAVQALLYRYRGQDDIIIGSTVTRRDHPAAENQVGCLIDTVALRGRVNGDDRAGALLARSARACREALSHRDEAPDPPFDVMIDYMPGGHGGFDIAETGLAVAEMADSTEAAHYESVFLVAESVDARSMSVRLAFDARRFTAATVAAIADRLVIVLRWLAQDGAAVLRDVDVLPPPKKPSRRLQVKLNTE